MFRCEETMTQKSPVYRALLTLGLFILLSNTGTTSLALANGSSAGDTAGAALVLAGTPAVCNFVKDSQLTGAHLGRERRLGQQRRRRP